MNFNEIIQAQKIPSNKHYLKRYFRFIENCVLAEGEMYEKHHILPQSLFPTYAKCLQNIKKLSLRQHFIAHWILAKTFGGTQWFAFNQMKRVGCKSILYMYGRKYIIEQIKLANTGKEKTQKNRMSISKRTQKTVVVRDLNGKLFRTSIENPKYMSGELVFYRQGYKHTPETIQKMRVSGKTPWNTGKTKENTPSLMIGSDKTSAHFIQTIWVTRKDDNKHMRILEHMFDETKFIKGRIGFKGFAHINNKRLS